MTPTKKASIAQEEHVAGELGGYRVAMSGAGWVNKADVMTPREFVECKTTTAASYSIKLADLAEAEREALLADRRMLFALEFDTGKPGANRYRRYFLLTEEEYLQMTVGD